MYTQINDTVEEIAKNSGNPITQKRILDKLGKQIKQTESKLAEGNRSL